MVRIQFCQFRPKGGILRSPARNSRCMWYVGTRDKKLMFELADCLRTRTKKKKKKKKNQAFPYECRSAVPGTALHLHFSRNRVCDKFESFIYAADGSTHPVSLEFTILTQKM